MGNTRDLFKKIRDTKGIFHAKIGTEDDKNGKDLTGAEEIKERWQEYPDKLYRKTLNDPDNHNGVVTHLEPDILKCEVKWALGSLTKNKANGCGVIPAAAAAAKSLQSCLTLCDPMDCSLPGLSIHGILQAKTLEWVAFSFFNA